MENTPNWVWFVKHIKTDLGLGDGDGYIMVSDRQKVSFDCHVIFLKNINFFYVCVWSVSGTDQGSSVGASEDGA